MRFSYSRVSLFKTCPYAFKLRYIDELETLPDTAADNALYLGTAAHTGIEKTVEEAVKQYYANYPILDDLQINEVIKLEHIIPMAKELLPDGQFEVQIEDDGFVGFIDLLSPKGNNHFKMFDFKYSNNIDRYMQSGQLHIYKYFYERTHPGHIIDEMYFVFLPKIMIRQKKTENLHQFRTRLREELGKVEVKIVQVDYDFQKVEGYLAGVEQIKTATEFPKIQSPLCRFCSFQKYCESNGAIDYEIINRKDNDMITLPENKRKPINQAAKKKLWIYGSAFSGKSTFADKFPDPLFLNTDGNIGNITAPAIPIKRIVKMNGRIKDETLPWEVFKETIEELEKKQNTFKTIVVDLLEDLREYCREYMYQKLGIEHESDAGFGKGYDMINNEFLGTIKRLMNLDYENIILISHEDTSKDITKKSGDKLTSIRPNINEKLANKVAGMVDMVARVIAYSDVDRRLSFKADDVVFGGGRLNIKGQEISLDYNKFLEIYSNDSKTTTSRI